MVFVNPLVVLGIIPVISLHQGIELIPVTLMRVPFYRYLLITFFCGLVVSMKSYIEYLTLKCICQPACMVEVNIHLVIVISQAGVGYHCYYPEVEC